MIKLLHWSLTKAEIFGHVAIIVYLMYSLFISLPVQLHRLSIISMLTGINNNKL